MLRRARRPCRRRHSRSRVDAAPGRRGPPHRPQPPGPSYQSQVCARLEGAARRDRPRRRRRSGTSRAGPPLRGRVEPPAGRARPAGAQGAPPGLRGQRGFFLFGGRQSQSQQCVDLNAQISAACAAISTASTSICSACGAAASTASEQRRAIMVALAQNNCGPQYRTAARSARRILRPAVRRRHQRAFGRSRQSGRAERQLPHRVRAHLRRLSISRSRTRPRRRVSREDEKTCQRMCPAAEVMLFSLPQPAART